MSEQGRVVSPARGPKVPVYWLTPAGEAWLREHPLPPLSPAPAPPETPEPPERYLSDEQRRDIAARWARLVL
jgi:hypothetical protein